MSNLAFVGAGRMANCHADALEKMDNGVVYGVYDTDKDVAEKFIQKHQGKRVYNSLAELAADPAVDGVLICNYTDQHYRTLTELLEAGKKKIFCEKALIRQLADGEELLQKSLAAEAQVMVGHHRRYIPGYAKLQQLIANDELGTIRMAKVALCHPLYDRHWGEFFADFDRSGGVILDMMTHLFDQLNWYFGEPERVNGASLMFNSDQPLPADYVSGTLTYKNGVICNIDGSWQRYGVASDRIEVYGDKACATFDGGDLLHVYRPGEHTEFSLGESSPYEEQMKGFVKMINNSTPPAVSLQDGFNSARVALALIDAAQKNNTFSF